MMLSRDGIAGLVCLALSIGLFALTFGLPPAVMVPVGPAFYPRVVILILGILSVILIVFDVLAMQRQRAAAVAPRATAAAAGPAPNYRLVLATFVEFGVYILLIPLLGFRISTFLFVLLLEITLEWPRSPRHWIVMILVAVATSLVCFYVFEDYLSVLLPRGTWSGM